MTARATDHLIRLRLHMGEFSGLDLPQLAVRPPNRITADDRRIIALLLEGKTDLQVARSRRTSVANAIKRVKAICKKLGVGSRDDLFRVLRAAVR